MLTDLRPEGVTADVERIFKRLDGRVLRQPADRRAHAPLPRERASSRWRAVTLLAPALVVVTTSALLIDHVRADQPRANVGSATPLSISTASGHMGHTRGGAASRRDEQPLRSLPSQAGKHPTDEGAPFASEAVLAPVTTRPLPRRAAEDGPEFQADSRAARTSGVASKRAGARETVPGSLGDMGCASGDRDDDCIFEDVLTADARLRRAYDRAHRAGVSPYWLADISRRWEDALQDADIDPTGTIWRYERLTRALDEERQEVAR